MTIFGQCWLNIPDWNTLLTAPIYVKSATLYLSLGKQVKSSSSFVLEILRTQCYPYLSLIWPENGHILHDYHVINEWLTYFPEFFLHNLSKSTSALHYPWFKSAIPIGIELWAKVKGVEISAWTYLRLDFCLQIYEKSYQNTEIEITITIKRNWIFAFCKKHCFKFIEIFANN